MARSGMTVWQQAKQIEYLLRNLTWSGGSAVFGQVVVTSNPKELPAQLGGIMPIAVIQVEDADDDQEAPALSSQRWLISLIQSNHNDPLGTGGVVGANRASELVSEGAGILEIEEAAGGVLASVLGDCGLRPRGRGRGRLRATSDPQLGYVVFRSYRWETMATLTRGYPPPPALSLSESGGTVTIDWYESPDRFDFYRYVVMRKTGSSPPTSTSDGTEVYASDDRTTTLIAEIIGSGTYSYGVFIEYDDRYDDAAGESPSTARQTSSAASATISF